MKNIFLMTTYFFLLINILDSADLNKGMIAYENKDCSTATKELIPLYKNNNPTALYLVATMLESGFCLKKDEKLAINIYQQCAGKAGGYCLSALGNVHMSGLIGKKDYTKAYMWYYLSLQILPKGNLTGKMGSVAMKMIEERNFKSEAEIDLAISMAQRCAKNNYYGC